MRPNFKTKTLRKCLTSAAMIAVAISATTAKAQDQEGAESDASDVIVVTGSRIARPDLNSSSPVSVIGSEEFQLQQTVNVEEVLNDMPQVIPGAAGTSNNPGDGVATVDLRGLGTNRTLVLVDGRRYISFDPSQVVDLNTIPSALIERVDVVTGGASAVYGSDAIAGVVNFVMKDDFSGVELNTSYELSSRGDGGRWNIDGTIGGNFDDGRGNIVLHAGYYKRKSIFAGDRDATATVFNDGGADGLFPGGSSSIPGFQFTLRDFNSALGLPGSAARFDADGNAVPFVFANDSYNFGPVNYLQVPQERFNVYAKAQYEINENFQPYIEAQFVNNRVATQLAPTPVSNGTPFRDGALGENLQIHAFSPFLGADEQAALQALDTDGDGYVALPSYGRRFLEVGPRRQVDDRNAFRIVGGMKGNIAGSWDYDGYYSYARTKNAQVQDGNIQLSALLSGLQTAFLDPNTGEVSATPVPGGTLVCADAGARSNGCVPINIFGANNISAEAVDYISIQAQNQIEAVSENAVFAITNNDLFDIGGGPVGIALGVEWRREFAEFIPDTFLASGDVGGFNAGNPTEGDYSVTEFFGEINVPLLSGQPFAETLELTGAARYSNYSNEVGNAFTWAAGARWEPISGLTFRGNYQKAIRGPNINELFGGRTVSFDGAVDICATEEAASGTLRDACIANGVPADVVGTNYTTGGTSIPVAIGGVDSLTEEKAKTWTVGAAFVPDFVRNLSITVDYYNITIDDAISRAGAQNLLNACLRFDNQPSCELIERTSTGELQRFVDFNVNAAILKTQGIDLGVNWSIPLAFSISGEDESNLTFDFKGSRLLNFDYNPLADVPIENECAGRFGRTCSDLVAKGPTPKWRHSLRSTFRDGPGFISLLWRYIGSSRDDDDQVEYSLEKLNAKSYFDLTLGYDVNDNLSFAVGVDNLFDTGFQPGAGTQSGGNVQQSNTFPSTYDTLGRYFSASARLRF